MTHRGQLVIVVMLLVAGAAAGLAWWHQYRRGEEVLAFWGPAAARRIRLALSLSRSVMSLSRDGLSRRLPDASPEELGLRFVALHYSSDLADELRAYLATRKQ